MKRLELPKLKLLEPIFGNYWKLLSEKTSRLRRKEETSLYKIILCGYLIYVPNKHELPWINHELFMNLIICGFRRIHVNLWKIGYAELKVRG